MKKYIIVLLAVVLVIVFACNKNKTSQVKIETPVKALVNSKFLDSTEVANDTAYESGYQFMSTKPGYITKIGCFVPQNLPYRVTLWDSATQELLISTAVEVADSTKFTYKDIAPLNIKANRKYIITVNNYIFGSTKKYFAFYKKSPNQFNLPISIGSITILRNLYAFCSTTNCFPKIRSGNFFLIGIPDFVFEPTE